MIALYLAAALLAPLFGLILNHPVSRRFHSARRTLGLFWHFATICLWGVLALSAGHRSGHEANWDKSRMALVMAGGLVYVESILLLSLHWPWERARRGAALRPVTAVGATLLATAPARIEGSETQATLSDPDPTGIDGPEEPLAPEAVSLLNRIQRIDRIPVDAIMTPRGAVLHVDESVTAEAALERMRQSGRSRLLVTSGGSLDRIVGVVHAKDLLPLIADGVPREPVRRHLRRWLRVAQGESVARLLEDFRKGRVHVGVVGDALGQTLGVVTLKDVFRYIAAGDEALRRVP